MLLWDTADPYHYVRMQPLSDRNDVLIVGGEDHRTGQAHDTDARFDCLEEWARKLFPFLGHVEFRWSGQVMEPVDGVAFIGRNPGSDNVFIVTGDSGQGMTHGTIAGLLIRDLINNCSSRMDGLVRPFAQDPESGGGVRPLQSQRGQTVRGLRHCGGVAEAANIPHRSGVVLRRGMQRVAAYCDENGQVREFSAVCPHLGCIIDWNDTEKTWDCPCHGSRFSTDGSVINGPANSGLSPVEDDDEPVVLNPVADSGISAGLSGLRTPGLRRLRPMT